MSKQSAVTRTVPLFEEPTMSDLTVKAAAAAIQKTLPAGKGEVELRLSCLAPGRLWEARMSRKRVCASDPESAVLALIIALGGSVPE